MLTFPYTIKVFTKYPMGNTELTDYATASALF